MINPDSKEMLDLKSKIDDRFYPVIFMMFDRLGAIDPSITAQYKQTYRESLQFISYKSLKEKMHLVFGVKN